MHLFVAQSENARRSAGRRPACAIPEEPGSRFPTNFGAARFRDGGFGPAGPRLVERPTADTTKPGAGTPGRVISQKRGAYGSTTNPLARDCTSVEAPLSEDRGFALTDRKLFQRAGRLSPSADRTSQIARRQFSAQGVCGRPLLRSSLFEQRGFVSPESPCGAPGSLRGS